MQLAQDLLTSVWCSGHSRIFARDKSLEDEEQSGRPLEIENDQVRGSLKLILQLHAEKFNIDHSIVVQHLNQIRNVKKHNKWVPHEQTEKNKLKTVILKCHLLLFYTTTTNHFSIGL